MNAVMHYLREISACPGEEVSDRELLRRFAEQRDQSAFSQLVRRHGAMVLGETPGPTLCQATADAAHCQTQGLPLPAYTQQALALTRTGLKMTASSKVLAVVALLVGLAGTALGLVYAPRDADPKSPGAKAPASEPPRTQEAEGKTLPRGAKVRLGSLDWQHDGSVFFVGYTGKGKRLITARQVAPVACTTCHPHPFEPDEPPVLPAGVFRIWDINQARELRRFGEAPSGGGVAVFGRGNGVRTSRRGGNGPAIAVALSADGRVLASAIESKAILVQDLDTGKELTRIDRDPKNPVVALALAPDGKLLAVSTRDGPVQFHDTTTGKPGRRWLRPNPEQFCKWGDTLLFSPDGKLLAATSLLKEAGEEKAILQIREANSDRILRTIKDKMLGSSALAFSADGQFLAWPAEDGTVRLEEVSSGKEVRRFGDPERTSCLAAVALSPDGKWLATRGYDQVVRLWEIETGKEVRQLTRSILQLRRDIGRFGSHQGTGAHSLVFSPDGKELLAGHVSGTVQRWDLASGKELTPGHKGAITGMIAAPDGKTLTTWGADLTVRHWDVASGKEMQEFPLPPSDTDAVLSPDGRLACFDTDRTRTVVWDIAAGKKVCQFDCPKKQPGVCPGVRTPGSLLWSPDGTTLTKWTADGAMHRFDAASGQKRPAPPHQGVIDLTQTEDHPVCLTSSPDGKILAGFRPAPIDRPGEQNFLFLWEPMRPDRVRTIEGIKSTLALAFSRDDRFLAAGHEDSITLWELVSGKERLAIQTGKAITALAFVGKGQLLASASADSTVLLWDLADLETNRKLGRAPLDAKQLQACWEDLGSRDGPEVQAAMRTLRSAPGQALALLRDRLPAAVAPDPKRVARLIDDLDHDEFEVRKTASTELEKLGDLVAPALKQALEKNTSVQRRRGLELLLDALQEPSPDMLRGIRGVEVLEGLATAEARQALRVLARGEGKARLTREAQEALARLTR